MGLLGWVEIISAALKFPDAVLRLVMALKKTDQEKHQELVTAIEAEAEKFKKTGRPTWG